MLCVTICIRLIRILFGRDGELATPRSKIGAAGRGGGRRTPSALAITSDNYLSSATITMSQNSGLNLSVLVSEHARHS